jgi:hypothetical protein
VIEGHCSLEHRGPRPSSLFPRCYYYSRPSRTRDPTRYSNKLRFRDRHKELRITKMLSNFAKSFSIDPSAPAAAASATPTGGGGGAVASFLRKASVTASGSPRSAQHAALLKTNVIPLALKLQREIRGRKYKVRRLGETKLKNAFIQTINCADTFPYLFLVRALTYHYHHFPSSAGGARGRPAGH